MTVGLHRPGDVAAAMQVEQGGAVGRSGQPLRRHTAQRPRLDRDPRRRREHLAHPVHQPAPGAFADRRVERIFAEQRQERVELGL